MNLDLLIRRKLLFVTGKGGIGKTLTAAAIARYAVSQGKKVCLIESNAEDQIAPLFGFPPIGHRLSQLEPNLWAINLNSSDNFRDFVVKHLGYEKIFEKVFSNGLVKSLIAMLPALAELTLLGRIYYTCELTSEPRFDLVIVDGYSSGHFYALLETPKAVMRSGLVGPVLSETQRIIDYLSAPGRSGILFLSTPEPLVVSECIDFLPKLQQNGMVEVIGIGVNRYLETSKEVIEDLKQTQTSVPQIKHFCDYTLQHYSQKQGSVESLEKAAKARGDLAVVYFRELGAVDEPLAPDFHQQFLGLV